METLLQREKKTNIGLLLSQAITLYSRTKNDLSNLKEIVVTAKLDNPFPNGGLKRVQMPFVQG